MIKPSAFAVSVSRQMQRPPSTSMATPVIMLASSEHRKAGGVADVFGRGEAADRDRRQELCADLGRVLAHEGLQQRRLAGDGIEALTRMPNGASSTAMARVAVMTQPFEALYQVRFGRGLTPAVRGDVEHDAVSSAA